MNDIVWTRYAVLAAKDAHNRRISSMAGFVLHPTVYEQMTEWAWLEALNAAADSQFSGIILSKGIV